MTSSYTVFGLRTPLITPGSDLASILVEAASRSGAGGFRDGDVLVVAETAVSTAEGNVIALREIVPDEESVRLGEEYSIDPRLVQCIREESDEIVGGIPGFLLCMKHGTLLPNAGIDESNAPPGCVTPLPRDPHGSALRIKEEIGRRTGARVGVIIADSRTHPMRVGCSGVAIGCAGIPGVIDARGRKDLYGRRLHVTRQALADNLASAAEVVMGEADESMPAAIVRGLSLTITQSCGMESIPASDCLFMGILGRRETGPPGPRETATRKESGESG
ncbi:MAG: coenzyme F420-0:L-glutamate ligase [Methanolinea sp.]|nr:coenzyme F420-0:L-glutamate ligase [Methanolinea sp.]